MSDNSEPLELAWREYQGRLGSLTEREETMIKTAYRSGWRACLLAHETPLPRRVVEQ
jgi:hypothetical protein